MPSFNARSARRPIFAEALESRTLLSSTPVLADQLISTGKLERFHASTLNGIPFTVQIRNGTVNIYKVDNRIELNAPATDGTTTLIVSGRAQMADVVIAGSLAEFRASSNLAGTMAVGGNIEKLTMAGISGTLAIRGNVDIGRVGGVKGTIAVGGSITKLTTGAVNHGLILSGAILVADSPIGNANDTFAPGSIGALVTNGPVINSVVAIGVSPGPDGVFGTTDDSDAGGGSFGSVTVADGANVNTRFEATSFGTVRIRPINSDQPLTRLVNPLSDYHFVVPKSAIPG